MAEYAGRSKEIKSNPGTDHASLQRKSVPVHQLADAAPAHPVQMALQEMAINSPQAKQLKAYQAMADHSRSQTVQKKGTQGKGLRSVSLQGLNTVQLRTIPVIRTDLVALRGTAMPALPAYDTAANIVTRQTLITATRAALAPLLVEVNEKKAAHGREVDSVAQINTRIAELPGEIADLTTKITAGSAARPPAPAGAWGAGAGAYTAWPELNRNVAANTASRTAKQTEQGTRAADLPVADLSEAFASVNAKLDDAQTALNARKKQRYFHDLITTTTPVLNKRKPEGTWGHGPSELGIFKYAMPAALNGVDCLIDPVEIHIHKPIGARTVGRVHVRGGEFDNTIIFSNAVARAPGAIGGWQGTVVQILFTLI